VEGVEKGMPQGVAQIWQLIILFEDAERRL
jgi:hypothetical protein